MAYIPPHVRKAGSLPLPQDLQSTGNPEQNSYCNVMPAEKQLYSVGEIHEYFWPMNEITEGNLNSQRGTLNDSEKDPGSLRYIVLFHSANPRWKDDKIIFVKTNLELLGSALDSSASVSGHVDAGNENIELDLDRESTSMPSNDLETNHTSEANSEAVDPSTSSEMLLKPIAVFEQLMNRRGLWARSFQFVGYYCVAKLQYLAPKSQALVKMMKQKWDILPANRRGWSHTPRNHRDSTAWDKSLSVPWAVIKLAEISKREIEEMGLKTPEIKIKGNTFHEFGSTASRKSGHGAADGEAKSVNEMLHELRLAASAVNESNESGQ